MYPYSYYFLTFFQGLRPYSGLLSKARTYLQIPLWQWGAGNVYLLVLFSWKVNIAENSIDIPIDTTLRIIDKTNLKTSKHRLTTSHCNFYKSHPTINGAHSHSTLLVTHKSIYSLKLLKFMYSSPIAAELFSFQSTKEVLAHLISGFSSLLF